MDVKPAEQKSFIEQILEAIKDWPLEQLLAGLSFLSKDMNKYLSIKSTNDPASDNFRTPYLEAMNLNRYYWEKFGPDQYRSLEDLQFFHQLTAEAAEGRFEPLALKDFPGLVTEWSRYRGWDFLFAYGEAFRGSILPSNTNLDFLKNTATNNKGQTVIIAESLLENSLAVEGKWVPLATFIAHLVVITCFEAIKAPPPANR